MALSDIEVARCRKELSAFVERRRPPAHLRAQVDLAYRLAGQSVEIFEVRPRFLDPSETHEIGVARATYVKRHAHWRVYWLRRDLRWHRYEPAPTVRDLAGFLDLVDRDEFCCFFG